MIQSNKELYQSINKIINELKMVRQFHYAEKLEEAFSISTIPSEVLGEIRLVLEDLVQANFAYKLDSFEDIRFSLEYLEKIL